MNNNPINNIKIKSFVSYAIHLKSDGFEVFKWKLGEMAIDEQGFYILYDNSGNEIMKTLVSNLVCKSDFATGEGGFLITNDNVEVYIIFPTKFNGPQNYIKWRKALGVSDSTLTNVLVSSSFILRFITIAILIVALFYIAVIFISK